MRKVSCLKKLLACSMLTLLFVTVQVFGNTGLMAKADESFSVQIVVEGISGIMASGTSGKSNALQALSDVLAKNNLTLDSPDSPYGGKYIRGIGDLKEKHFGGNDGWMYENYTNGKYDMPYTSIDTTILKNGDKLIVYYGTWGITLIPNDVTVDATKDGKSVISLNNISNDYATGKDIITPIKSCSAKLDGNPIAVTDGKITLNQTISAGKHQLSLSDFKGDACPGVVADTIDLNVTNTAAPTDSTAFQGNVQNSNIQKDIQAALSLTKKYMQGKPQDAWLAVSMSKLGVKPDESFINQNAQDIKKNGIKDFSNTDIEKLIIGVTTCGYSSYNFCGYNLARELYNRDINKFAINDAIFGLIAYNYAGISGSYKITPEVLKTSIISKMISSKVNNNDVYGWTYMGNSIDPDLTGIAITAISTYYSKDANVKQAVDKAVKGLSSMQNNSGYIVGPFGISSESLSFVILGLTSIGADPEGQQFTKPNGDLVQALLSFRGTNGGFKHSLDGTNDDTASEEALRALIALNEFKKNGTYNYYSKANDLSSLKVYSANSNASAVLPKTGTIFDSSTLEMLGTLTIAIGIFIYTRRE